MKLVSRKVPKTLEDETVSLLPEDPEDMVSKTVPLVPCDSQTLASSEAEPWTLFLSLSLPLHHRCHTLVSSHLNSQDAASTALTLSHMSFFP